MSPLRSLPPRWLLITSLALLLGSSACTCGGTGGMGDGGNGGGSSDAGPVDAGPPKGPCEIGVTTITVTPANSREAAADGGVLIQFKAVATLANGTQVDITSTATWSVSRDDDGRPGNINAMGRFFDGAALGGHSTVRAELACAHGETGLDLVADAVVGGDEPDAGRFLAADAGTPLNQKPVVLYPNDKSRLPRNLVSVLFQWQKNGNDFFRLTFDGPHGRLVVYTNGAAAECAGVAGTAGCWQSDPGTWRALAESNSGESVTFTVEGVSSQDPGVQASAPIAFSFSKRNLTGAIFYWSTTVGGVKRLSIFDQQNVPYATANPSTQLAIGDAGSTAQVSCVACHTVSRSGKRMVGGTQTSGAPTGVYIYEITKDPKPLVLVTNQISGDSESFGTFSPDDKRVIVTSSLQRLAEYDTDTGAKIADLDAGNASLPDWSPTGTELAFIDHEGRYPAGASIMVAPRDGLGWGPARVLVPFVGSEGTNLFPSFSPTGQHLVFTRGAGSQADPQSRVWLVATDGGSAPVELKNANCIVNGVLKVANDCNHVNYIPTWAPSGDTEWIAFNSKREYGALNGGHRQQIWVTAIDRSKLGTGVDPSYASFWLPLQGLNEDNHRAFWVRDVRDIVEGDDGGVPACRTLNQPCGVAATACCDGLVCLGDDAGSTSTCRSLIQ